MINRKILTFFIMLTVTIVLIMAGIGYCFWKVNSYTAGNWRVEYDVREVLEDVFPELDYEIVSRKLYETKFHGIDSMVWEFTIKCEGDDENYTVHNINRKTDNLLYWNIAAYSEIYYDYDEKIKDEIDTAYDLGDYRVSLDNDFVRSSRYEFSINEMEQTDDIIEKILHVYDVALAESKGSYPVEIICLVSGGGKDVVFYTRDFYKDGKVIMDENERAKYIRDKLRELQ